MDLREYEYLSRRPDTFPRSTLVSVKKALLTIGSPNAALIDKVLATGYLEPPPGYKWHGFYKVDLARAEVQAVIGDLVKARDQGVTGEPDEKDALHYLGQYINYAYRLLSETPESYEAYKARQTYYDLRGISFDSFLDLVFDHPVAVGKDKTKDQWFWKVGIDFWVDWDKAHIVNRYIELFSRSDGLLERYPKDKLEQGFWFMMSGSLDFTVEKLIHDDDVSVELKEALIESMYFLYEKLFYYEPLETSSDMWWDNYTHEYSVPGIRDPINNEEDRRLQDLMFRTLERILALDSHICQGAALHGLGHLMHPDTERVIKDFIKKHPDLTEEQINYCNNCIMGEIL